MVRPDCRYYIFVLELEVGEHARLHHLEIVDNALDVGQSGGKTAADRVAVAFEWVGSVGIAHLRKGSNSFCYRSLSVAR